MEQYEASTRPLIRYYEERKLLVTVDAHGSPEEIFERTKERLAARVQG
ncbi:MAG: hypothetical protein U5L04_01245 [Trueperaceae bacterium]|nr:hypothetical protein [Trueperaceae bacterium]